MPDQHAELDEVAAIMKPPDERHHKFASYTYHPDPIVREIAVAFFEEYRARYSAETRLVDHLSSTAAQHAPGVGYLLTRLRQAEERGEALLEALEALLPFCAHTRCCQVDETDFCTCGKKRMVDAARAALSRCAQPEESGQESITRQ